MDILTYIIVTIIVLALGSLTVRDIIKYKGKKLILYIISIVLSVAFGAFIADGIASDADYTCIGAMIGLAAVKIGPYVGNAASDFFKSIGKILPKALTNKISSIFQSKDDDDLSGN